LADTKIKDLTAKTPVLADQIVINDVTDDSDGVVTFAQIETIFSASADTIGGLKTYTTGPIMNDAVKLAFGDDLDSTIVDTGSGMLIDIDEQNAGSKSLVIESDTTALLTINDTSITSSVFLDVPDIETATVSARDGSLCATIADSTGIATFVTGTVLVAPVLGTPASGTLTNCTGLPFSGIANGTDGELITWDSSGVAANVAAGTSGQILTSNGAGTEPTFQAAAGGSLTPWTEDIDADGFDLKDLSNLEFRVSGSAPSGTVATIHRGVGEGIGINNVTGEELIIRFASVDEYKFSATEFNIGEANNIVIGTTTGTKIGTGTTQKIGFWNVTPVVQPGHIADPTGGSTVDTECRAQLALLLADMAETGLQAAS